MTKEKVTPKFEEVKALFTENSDALRNLRIPFGGAAG